MTRKAILCTFISLSLSSGAMFAQGRGQPGDRGDRRDRGAQAQPPNRHPPSPPQRNAPRRDPRDHWQNQAPPGAGQRELERGAGPYHAFRRGGRLPDYYHQRRYVVDDWRRHNLRAPPRGYHWVQTGDDFVLVAIATGVILQLLLNH
jgi:Ni/Co efflux regulator RcnB